MSVEERCFARAGLLGNPSDGFGGRTLSCLIGNFSATVRLAPHACVEIVPSELCDTPSSFGTMERLHSHVSKYGYYGVQRLMLATCKKFFALCLSAGLDHRISKGFRLTYETSIPRMVGLSGSSALIVAAFRALLKYFSLTIDDLHIRKQSTVHTHTSHCSFRLTYIFAHAVLPQVILSIERDELGIAAGLQDRVIQVYGGVVKMDFSPAFMDANGHGEYTTPLAVHDLPHMYLAYNYKAGGDSGSVHSTVKTRWAERDADLVRGMQRLGALVDLGVDALKRRDIDAFADLMDENFALRRAMYGDDVVGLLNIQAVELVRSFGFGVKFTGSGGACVCIRRGSSEWYVNAVH